MLTCCIRLLCHWSSRLYHPISYICCFIVLSILVLIWLVLMTLFSAVVRRNSVSLQKFLFLKHVHIFSCEMSIVRSLTRLWSCFSSHFSVYCHSADLRVVSIFSGDCNKSSSTFFCVVFLVIVSMCQRCLQCWQVLFLSLFLTLIVCQCHLWDAMPYV